MGLPPNAQPVPPPATPGVSKEEKARRAEISKLREKNQKKLDVANTKARRAALMKKGSGKYDYQSIQGATDFGAGEAGPGVPWSIKHTKTPEKLNAPKQTLPAWAKTKLPSVGSAGRPLWPIGNVSPLKSHDPKLAAIRRRLGNG